MTGSLPIPFALGETVWWIGVGQQIRTITCPECLGTRAITMIMENGTHVSLGCRACQSGYDPPRGTIQENYFEHKPTAFKCTDVRIDSKNEFWYTGSTGYAKHTDLFANLAECQKACDELNKQKDLEQEDIRIRNLKSKRDDLAWSAHYWTRKRADLRKDLEAVENRLSVIKAKPNA